VAAVNVGKLAATVQQRPELGGKMGAGTAKLLIDGKSVDPVFRCRSAWSLRK
jgi:ribose transport system substrate-binding protein